MSRTSSILASKKRERKINKTIQSQIMKPGNKNVEISDQNIAQSKKNIRELEIIVKWHKKIQLNGFSFLRLRMISYYFINSLCYSCAFLFIRFIPVFYNKIDNMCITFFSINPFQKTKHFQSSQNIGNIQPTSLLFTSNYQNSTFQPQYQNQGKENRFKKILRNNQHHGQIADVTDQDEYNSVQFVIAFNRDQNSHRKTLTLAPFEEDPNIYAGRDMVSSGTWLGVNIKTGIMVILTNYDFPHIPIYRKGKSRGQLVKHFLSTSFVPQQIQMCPESIDQLVTKKLKQILAQCRQLKYPPFNLTIYNIKSNHLLYICSEITMQQPLILQKHEAYGLCNSDIFTLWSKTQHGLNLFKKTLDEAKHHGDQQIIASIVNKVMKDTTKFSENLDQQSSIFVEPFYNSSRKAERMTKSTFVAIVRKKLNAKGQKDLELAMREITHEDAREEIRTKCLQKQDLRKKEWQYDHWTQTIVDFKLKL